jgi:hypothetical protein
MSTTPTDSATDREKAIDVLLAKQEISDAMMRYCRGIDRHDEELIRGAYHDDAYDDHGFGGGARAWDMAKAYGQPSDVYKAAHHFIGNLLIEVDGDTAGSETYFVATQRFEHDGTDYDFVIAGRYVDRWERRDGPFRISRRTLVWDWMRTDPVTTPWPGPDHSVPKATWGAPPLATEEARMGQGSKEDFSYEVIRGR